MPTPRTRFGQVCHGSILSGWAGAQELGRQGCHVLGWGCAELEGTGTLSRGAVGVPALPKPCQQLLLGAAFPPRVTLCPCVTLF